MVDTRVDPKKDQKAKTGLFRRRRARRKEREVASPVVETPPVDIAPNDPILSYFQSTSGVVELDGLELESPGLTALKEAGVKLVVPLVTQGELIGLLNLGQRLSEQEYSGDDRKLLADLAAQAAPALRMGQLVREQQVEARSRERIEQELKVAQLIQQQFLPKELPQLPGWQVAAFYRPAREVGGDFYDFIELPDGRVGILVGDVTDKGVPAALVMASTRSVIRSSAPRLIDPGKVLEHVNEQLVPDIPAQMFVTCLYGILDPSTGSFVYANAGHNLPYASDGNEVREMRATGMPLGLLPGMPYDEQESVVQPGEVILLHSDGIAEAHNEQREMFGFPRLLGLTKKHPKGEELIDEVLSELDRFTGGGEQEDDITLVALTRSGGSGEAHFSIFSEAVGSAPEAQGTEAANGQKLLAEFDLPSVDGNERIAMSKVAEAVASFGLEESRLDRLKTAVAEATMNAIEHGNGLDAEIPVLVKVLAWPDRVAVRITDHGGGEEVPEPETPDIQAKLDGLQKPRGWGLFLIKNMVDEMNVSHDDKHHTIELVMGLRGDES
jgi:serine phosphatase RsbU (regulator of sigma subunit)/anti-sigma regulatory factor (Ser/Thr protein kinase)